MWQYLSGLAIDSTDFTNLEVFNGDLSGFEVRILKKSFFLCHHTTTLLDLSIRTAKIKR